MANFNISSFFNNSRPSGFGSINFSDYALIKSGSYKKLMKAYFAQQKDTSATKEDKTTKKKPVDDTVTTTISKMKSEADGLKTAAESLNDADLWKQTKGEYDKDKITSAVKKFASEYNDVLNQSAKVNAKDVVQQTGFMTSMSKTMSNALSKIGVTIGADGKMSVNEDTLKEANMKDVKSMFYGSHSYGSQIAQKASAISSAALRSSSMYSSNGALSSTLASLFNQSI